MPIYYNLGTVNRGESGYSGENPVVSGEEIYTAPVSPFHGWASTGIFFFNVEGGYWVFERKEPPWGNRATVWNMGNPATMESYTDYKIEWGLRNVIGTGFRAIVKKTWNMPDGFGEYGDIPVVEGTSSLEFNSGEDGAGYLPAIVVIHSGNVGDTFELLSMSLKPLSRSKGYSGVSGSNGYDLSLVGDAVDDAEEGTLEIGRAHV